MGIVLIGSNIPGHAAKPTHNKKMTVLKETKKSSSPTGRPNAPSMHSIECTYEKGHMDLTFTGGINNAAITCCLTKTISKLVANMI